MLSSELRGQVCVGLGGSGQRSRRGLFGGPEAPKPITVFSPSITGAMQGVFAGSVGAVEGRVGLQGRWSMVSKQDRKAV